MLASRLSQARAFFSELGDDGGDEDETSFFLSWIMAQISVGSFRHVVVEFGGSFVLCFAYICGDILLESSWVCFVWGMPLLGLTYGAAGVSGAHFNPAVSIAVGLSGRGAWRTLLQYVTLQFAGSLLGSIMACVVTESFPNPLAVDDSIFGPYSTFLCEMVYSGLWCFVFLSTTLCRKNNPVRDGNQFYGLAIAAAAMGGASASRLVSGGLLNPAFVFAQVLPQLLLGQFEFWEAIWYVAGQLAGAFLAAITYRVVRPAEALDELAFVRFQPRPTEKMVVEGLGSLILTFTVGLYTYTTAEDGPWSIGLVLMSMNYAVSDVSGGLFNPILNWVVWLCGGTHCGGKLHASTAVMYTAIQYLGSFVGAFLYFSVFYYSAFGDVSSETSLLRGLILQSLFAFALAYVALSCLARKGINTPLQRNFYFALGIGGLTFAFTVICECDGIANPASCFAIYLARCINGSSFLDALPYTVADFLGASFAVLLFTQHDSISFEKQMMLSAPPSRFYYGAFPTSPSTPISPTSKSSGSCTHSLVDEEAVVWAATDSDLCRQPGDTSRTS